MGRSLDGVLGQLEEPAISVWLLWIWFGKWYGLFFCFPNAVIIAVIWYVFFGFLKLFSLMVTAKVNFEETIAAISIGSPSRPLGALMTVSTDLPTIRRPISPKHIISASSVPSVGMKHSLYLYIVHCVN